MSVLSLLIMSNSKIKVSRFIILLLIDQFCPGEMASELEQEATTVLYLNESTNISTTGIVSHSDFLWSVCDHDISF